MAEQMIQKKTGELVANQTIPKGYKQTELGIIPEDWSVFEFSKHFVIYAGGDVPKKSLSEIRTEKFQYPIFANALNEKGLYGYTALKRAKPDSITVTARGYLGHAEYRDEYFFPIVRLLVLEPKGGLSSKYTSFAINGRLNVPVESTGVPQLTAPQLGRMSIVGPVNVGEQNSIAHALSEMDDLIYSVKQLIAKKQAIKTATMQQLLTGRTRLPQFALRPDGTPKGYKSCELGPIPEDWSCDEIGSFAPFITSGSRGWADFYSDYGDLFVRITNTTRGSIYLDLSDSKYVKLASDVAEASRTSIDVGDILISITADIGICTYIDDSIQLPAYINQHLALVRFNTSLICSKFVAYFLASERVQSSFLRASDQGAKAGMNLDSVRKIKIIVPTEKEQTAIATILSDMDSELNALEQKLAKARDLKQGMMQQLLTGRIRLPLPQEA